MKIQKKYFVTGWNFNQVHTSLGEIKKFEMRFTGNSRLKLKLSSSPRFSHITWQFVYKCV